VKNYNKIARQAGMTLIELTVVLLVLIGLAVLMIPYVGGFISKTHDSTGSDSLAATNAAIQRYDVQFMGHPGNYDSLMDTSLTAGNLYTKMMGGASTMMPNDYLKAVTIDGKAFTDIGISSLMVMNTTTSNATFNATASSVSVADGTDYRLAALNVKGTDCVMMGATPDAMGCISNDADLSAILGRTVNTSANNYFVFGIGQDSGMVGKTISEAPVHFAKTGAMSAANKYNRLIAVYEAPMVDTCIASNGQGFTAYWDITGTAVAAAPADETACLAIDPADELLDGTLLASSSTVIGATSWTGSTQAKARFLTTVMPMMKLEGLGGALASHYQSVGG